jgi:hypothetical protein
MNKTVYLRDEEVPIWEKARELANDKLSPMIVKALKRYIAEKEALGKGYERIELKFNDSQDNDLPKIKAFYGRWILDEENPARIYRGGNDVQCSAVAETAKGNVVVYTHTEDPERGCWGYKLLIYPSFELAASESSVNYAIREAVEKRGVPVEELDI